MAKDALLTLCLPFHYYCFEDAYCNLNFGLVTKSRACKVASQKGNSRVTFHALGSAKECEGRNPHIPKWTPILGVRVPNGLPNIIEKLLKLRCLKWARMTHLDIWNTSYGQKKGQKSNWQFDSRPLKFKNLPNFLMCRWCATNCWNFFDEGYNFASDFISIEGIHTKLWGPKTCKSPNFGNFEIPIWKSQDKMSFRCGPCGEAQSIL